MAITIIGADRGEDSEPKRLPEAELDLPHPASAPANHRLLGREDLLPLLGNQSPLVRTYALEQIARRDDEDWDEDILRLIDDEDELVASESIALLGRRKYQKAVPAIQRRFEDGEGDVVAAAANALGQLAPETLLESLSKRGRLDDEAYAAMATSLAVIGSKEIVAFLDKALNRAGALKPERRSTLYGAALLSGDEGLIGRVIGMAIDDSKQDAPKGSAFPTRAALGALSGLPLSATAKEAGLELFDQARDFLEEIIKPALEEAQQTQLTEALKVKKSGEVIKTLGPLTARSIDARPDATDTDKQDIVDELGTMPERRRGLLEVLVARADAIGALEVSSAALFVATAVKAASVLVAGATDEASSAAVQALSKALENEHSPEALAAMDEDALTELFKAKSSRNMRRILVILTKETFYRSKTLLRFAKAAIRGGHARDLLDTLGEVEEVSVQNSILDAFSQCREEAEAAVVEVFEERPVPERTLPYALAVSEELRTERIGLAIGRRFYDLRQHGRSAVARTLMRVGDKRFLPLLESRAFEGEPEEVAWAALALSCGEPSEGKLAAAVERAQAGRNDVPQVRRVRLPLTCKRCKETLTYGFKRVFLDVEAKDKWADPAFVGEVKCKACGFDEDPFEPTDAAAQILTNLMMEFLAMSRSGQPMARPLVTPASTQINGRRVGYATALRELDKDVAASPDAIRPRLHRARLRTMLERPGVEKDIEQILATDPDCVEAMTLRASVEMQRGDPAAAVATVAPLVKRLNDSPDQVRFYDVGDAGAFKDSLEELLVELKGLGATIPDDIDLTRAEARIREFEQMVEIEQERQRQVAEAEQRRAEEPPEQKSLDPAQMAKVGRNDPCPCGSGKKFKKCHGAR